MKRSTCIFAAVALAMLALAPWGPVSIPRVLAQGGSAGDDRSNKPNAESSPERSALHDRGRIVYERHCVGCHGPEGDGGGEVADLLYPRPRNFVEARFKFSSRATPGLPTEEDLMAVLRSGLKGTAMPAYRWLPESDLRSVIGYLKTFSERWDERPAPPIQIDEDPFAEDPERGIALGDRVYHIQAKCIACHPAYHDQAEFDAMNRELGLEPFALRADAHLPVPQENSDATVTVPTDFKRDWIKTSPTVENLYRVIGAGITTTAMPTWVGSIGAEELWGVAYYTAWLVDQRPYRLDPAQYRPRPAVDRLKPLEPAEEAEEFIEEDEQ